MRGTARGGYLRVQLSSRRLGKEGTPSLHLLVAAAFLGPRPEDREVNHIDGNKLNNAVSNLEYVTRAENVRHSFRLGLVPRPSGAAHHNSKLSEDDVVAIRAMRAGGERLATIAARFGVTESNVCLICKGHGWVHVKVPSPQTTSPR